MVSLEQPGARDWDFPRGVAGIGLLVAVGGERGVASERLLRGTGLVAADVADHERIVTAGQELGVVRNLIAAAPEVSGVEVGVRYHLGTFGVFGFALLTSPTILDAVNLGLRFIDLSFTFAIPSAEVADGEIQVLLSDDGLPGDVRRFLVERDAVAIHNVLGELRPGGVPLVRAGFAFSAPPRSTAYADALGVEPTFGLDRHVLVFDAALLDEDLPQANPHSQALAEALCRDVVSRRRVRSGITQEVRVLATQRLTRGAAMEDVASDLGVSARTLRRRLADEGTSYQSLLDEVRESLAEELLASGHLGVEDTALRLGYAEASSFIHAFKRWKGVTPAAFARTARVT